MTAYAYAPDATGVPALWPWVVALPPRIHCATPGCVARPPKPRPGDAPAAAVWCAACRVAAGYDAAMPCATDGCDGVALPMAPRANPALAPYCPPCRGEHVAAIRRGTHAAAGAL